MRPLGRPSLGPPHRPCRLVGVFHRDRREDARERPADYLLGVDPSLEGERRGELPQHAGERERGLNQLRRLVAVEGGGGRGPERVLGALDDRPDGVAEPTGALDDRRLDRRRGPVGDIGGEGVVKPVPRHQFVGVRVDRVLAARVVEDDIELSERVVPVGRELRVDDAPLQRLGVLSQAIEDRPAGTEAGAAEGALDAELPSRRGHGVSEEGLEPGPRGGSRHTFTTAATEK